MTKEEAEKEVQRLLADAAELVFRAEKLMDEHRFSAEFLSKDYCPSALTEEEIEQGDLPYAYGWMSAGDGGMWLSSSDKC